VESASHNFAFDMTHKVGLYVEGIRIAFTSAQMLVEDGVLPKLSFNVPATPEMRGINQRARVHLVVQEPVKNHNIIMFEGEIQARGFAKTAESREINFVAAHVLSHFDAYEITALDQISYLDALMAGDKDQTTVVGTATGNLLEYFTPQRLVALLQKQRARELVPELRSQANQVTEKNLSISQFIIGAFLLYDQIFSNSRLKETYTYDAVNFHQLISRVRGPSVNLLRWSEFYTELMTAFLTTGLQQIGGRMTFFDLIRSVCQNFLYQVTVIPNAESFTKQLQVKPLTHFNAIPKCNVIFPAMSTDYQFQEDLKHKPTRLRTVFLPPTVPNADPNTIRAVRANFTVFAPAELQYRWQEIVEKANPIASAKAAKEQEKKKKEKEKEPPKTLLNDPSAASAAADEPLIQAADNLPFLTLEEDRRGIVAAEYTLPPLLAKTLLTNILQDTGTTPTLAATIAPGIPTAEGSYAALRTSSEPARLTRYFAFLCMALGDGGGLDRKRFLGPSQLTDADVVPFPATKSRHVVRAAQTNAEANTLPQTVVVMPIATAVTRATHPNRLPDEARLCGANYVIGTDGTIFETGQRKLRLFQESTALPFGIRLAGVPDDQVAAFNAQIPPRGTSFNNWLGYREVVMQGILAESPTLGQRTNTFTLSSSFRGFKGASLRNAGDPIVLQLQNLTEHPADLVLEQPPPGALLTSNLVSFTHTPEAYTFTLAQAIVPSGVPVTATVRFRNQERFSTAKPFFLLSSAASGKVTAVTAAVLADRIQKARSNPFDVSGSSLTPRETVGGPVGKLVVAVCTRTPTLTPQQIRSVAYIAAALRELNVSELKNGTRSYKGVTEPIVRLVQDLYQDRSPFSGPPLSASLRQALTSQANAYRETLYKAFQTWEKTLENAAVDTTGVLQNVDPTEAVNDPPLNEATDPGAGSPEGFSAPEPVANLPASRNLRRPDEIYKKGALNQYIENYIAAYLNAQFQLARIGPQTFSGTCAFNPYAMVGYPCLIMDTAKVGYDLVGYLHAATYTFTPESASCTFTYTHLRQANVKPGVSRQHPSLREPIIPFKKPVTNQLIYLMPENVSQFRNDIAKLEAYLRKFYPGLVVPSSHLPIQLLGIKRLTGSQESKFSPPPFMYNGSWGLRDYKSRVDFSAPDPMLEESRDYSMYAVTVGYNEAKNNMAAVLSNPAADQNFIFADTLIDMDNVREYTLNKAYDYVYRGVQRVGQNNVTEAQSSVVDWEQDSNIHSEPKRPALDGKARTTPTDDVHEAAKLRAMPERLKVWARSPVKDATGAIKQEGRKLEMDARIQSAVLAHNDRVRGNKAFLDGTDTSDG
jgi:hypothetical protein